MFNKIWEKPSSFKSLILDNVDSYSANISNEFIQKLILISQSNSLFKNKKINNLCKKELNIDFNTFYSKMIKSKPILNPTDDFFKKIANNILRQYNLNISTDEFDILIKTLKHAWVIKDSEYPSANNFDYYSYIFMYLDGNQSLYSKFYYILKNEINSEKKVS